ncbi:MAG: alpha-L-fucosidase C-terminal domain-containing protein [candidate division Zixibacteria bacterium]|nr:alpha-L-fucosidase C-terminal domain-containing protein [candidate division Zixibacteria bacterium]
MKVNGSALYYSRAIAPYKEGNICFTRMPDRTINAIYLAAEDEKQPPEAITIKSFSPKADSKVTMSGIKEPLAWKKTTNGFVIHIPESARTHPPCNYAWSFQFTPEGL